MPTVSQTSANDNRITISKGRIGPLERFAVPGAIVLSIKLIGAGVALVLQVSLARALGHQGYGQYAYVFAWLQLMLIYAHGGFATAALRYVAEYRARGQLALIKGFLKRSTQIVLMESVALALLMAACSTALYYAESENLVASFLIASSTLPVLALFLLGGAIVRGLGQVIPSMLVTLAPPLLLVAPLLSIPHVLQIRISSSEALVLNLGAALAALAIVIAMQRHFVQVAQLGSQYAVLTREWLGTATQMMVASSLIHLQGRTGIIISGLLLDARDAGTYAAMEQLADVPLLGLASVNLLAAPTFAALHAQGRRLELKRYARITAWAATCFMLVTVVPLVLFGNTILRCFGSEFVSGYPVLLVLLGGMAVNASCGSVGYLLSMTGHQRDMVIVAFFGLCFNLLLSLMLIPRYGVLGTSVANAVSIAVWNLSMLLIVRRRLGIWTCIGYLQ